MRLRLSQRSRCASSHTLAIGDQLLGARRGRDEVLERRRARQHPQRRRRRSACRATPRAPRWGSIVIAHRFSRELRPRSPRTTPSRRNARDTRSCSATSQTIVRRPARGGRQTERGGDRRLADAALAGHVEEPPVAQECFHRGAQG